MTNGNRISWAWLAGGGCGLVILLYALLRGAEVFGASGLTITNLVNGSVKITITNASATDYFQIESQTELNSHLSWVAITNGVQGQTNFTVSMGIAFSGFFRAVNCVDCDGDGIPNYQDADPWNTNVGTLAVTIDDPANGVTIP
jgi:hypothetical protein